MIALKLIFQSLAGVGAAAACVSGSVYGMSKSSTNSLAPINNLLLFSYYLVSATKETQNEAQKPMWTSSEPPMQQPRNPSGVEEVKAFFIKQIESVNEKNYTCKFTTNEIDDSCNVFYIKGNEDKATIDIEKIKDFIKNGEKTTNEIYKTPSNSSFDGLKFFLLRVSNNKKHLIKTDLNSTINLLSQAKDGPDKGKSYGTLTVHAEITKEKAKGKLNLFIAKLVDVATEQSVLASTSQVTHKCHFKKNPNEKKSCTIVSLPAPNGATDKENIEFKNISITNTQTLVNLSPTKFFLISFSEEIDYSSIDLTADSFVFVETTTSAGSNPSLTTKETELKIEAPIFALKTNEGKLFEVLIN